MNSAEFSPGSSPLGPRILTASQDGAVRLWRYQWKDLLKALDNSTQICLTVEQREMYLREPTGKADYEHGKCMEDKHSTASTVKN